MESVPLRVTGHFDRNGSIDRIMLASLIVSSSRWALACAVLIGVSTLGTDARAQGYPSQQPQGAPANPMCVRLEAQLASIDRGGVDPARAEQIRRYEDAANKQQHELDRVTVQARRMGCDSSGFFSLFNGQSAQCGPVNNQIQQMRANLDQITGSLERLRGGGPGNAERDSQRRSVLLALAQNNCGPQYANAARGPGGFFENLFGGGNNNNYNNPNADLPPPQSGAPSGTYRTVCVRSCDGYYFPISFATVQSRFADDERTCKNQCPATEANLFTYRNPGEDINQAVSISGQAYTSLPNAFHYRQSFNPTCTCKATNETWSEALKHLDDKSSLQQGDIIVTEDRAKKMSQPKALPSKKGAATAAPPANTPSANPAPAAAPPGDANSTIRTVGPTFLPAR